mmetsp:Transcript_32085/g.92065  ORF Transcript_32085/g.92065 Transcript_32085/m.92065 type:complete len:220 (-) Transcript_32085:848-1507(-)
MPSTDLHWLMPVDGTGDLEMLDGRKVVALVAVDLRRRLVDDVLDAQRVQLIFDSERKQQSEFEVPQVDPPHWEVLCPVPEEVIPQAHLQLLNSLAVVVHDGKSLVCGHLLELGRAEELRQLQAREYALELHQLQGTALMPNDAKHLLQRPVEAMQLTAVQALPQLLLDDAPIGVAVYALIHLLQTLGAEVEELFEHVLAQVTEVHLAALRQGPLHLLNV